MIENPFNKNKHIVIYRCVGSIRFYILQKYINNKHIVDVIKYFI